MKNRTTLAGLILASAFVLLAGGVKWAFEPTPPTRLEHQQQMRQAEVRQRFEQAVVMLHARQYDHAVTALHRVLQLSPRMPEAHVNMGYALLGLQRHDAAAGFFRSAIELQPAQANAYYGLALVAEAQEDYETALGAMRSYLHLGPANEEKHRTRARAAIWEYEEKLGRDPAAAQARSAQAAASSVQR
jgi:tetratricopeptide (TPR) repeat protein